MAASPASRKRSQVSTLAPPLPTALATRTRSALSVGSASDSPPGCAVAPGEQAAAIAAAPPSSSPARDPAIAITIATATTSSSTSSSSGGVPAWSGAAGRANHHHHPYLVPHSSTSHHHHRISTPVSALTSSDTALLLSDLRPPTATSTRNVASPSSACGRSVSLSASASLPFRGFDGGAFRTASPVAATAASGSLSSLSSSPLTSSTLGGSSSMSSSMGSSWSASPLSGSALQATASPASSLSVASSPLSSSSPSLSATLSQQLQQQAAVQSALVQSGGLEWCMRSLPRVSIRAFNELFVCAKDHRPMAVHKASGDFRQPYRSKETWVFEWPYTSTGSVAHASLPLVNIRRSFHDEYWAATFVPATGQHQLTLQSRSSAAAAAAAATTTSDSQTGGGTNTPTNSSIPAVATSTVSSSSSSSSSSPTDEEGTTDSFLFEVIFRGDRFALRHVASQSWVTVNSDGEVCLKPIANSSDHKTRARIAQNRRARTASHDSGTSTNTGRASQDKWQAASGSGSGSGSTAQSGDGAPASVSWELDDAFLFSLYTKVAFQCLATKRFVSTPKHNPNKPVKVHSVTMRTCMWPSNTDLAEPSIDLSRGIGE